MPPRDDLTMLAGMQDDAAQHDEHLKEFFLDLARPAADTDDARAAARERWNAWRSAPENAEVRVNFAGVNFGEKENRVISFAGFEFGDWAGFEETKFSFGARFDRATFGDHASFDRATFALVPSFDGVTFGRGASFDDATFWSGPKFDHATFEHGATFNGAAFGVQMMKISGVRYEAGASFSDTVFQGGANFAGATVEPWLERQCAKLFGEAAGGDAALRKKREQAFRAWQKVDGIGPHAFLDLDFSDARILGPISFARRSFERPADFTGARFHAPPDFDGATNLQRIDFTGARVGFAPPEHPRWTPHWTEDSSVPLRLRAFRAVAEQTKNHDLERDLYIEERKAERGVVRKRLREAYWAERNDFRQVALLGPLFIAWLWRRAMDVYWLLSDYGRSLARPPVWLLVTLWPFVWTFDASLTDQRRAATRAAFAAAVEGKADAAAATKRTYYAATRQLAISNTIPFVGSLSIDGEVKKFLLCGAPPGDDRGRACAPIAPRGYQLTLIAQNMLSALLLFFFGLALRNYFKVK